MTFRQSLRHALSRRASNGAERNLSDGDRKWVVRRQSRPLLHHVEINVSDLARSREFRQWLLGKLGYGVYQEWDQGVSFRLGPTHIVFAQTPAQHLAPPYHRRRTGLNHLAFHASSTEQVDSLTEKLRERGVAIL